MKQSVWIAQFPASAECGFADSKLMLIHQPDDCVSMRDLFHLSPELAIPAFDFNVLVRFMVLSGDIFEKWKEFSVTGIGDHY